MMDLFTVMLSSGFTSSVLSVHFLVVFLADILAMMLGLLPVSLFLVDWLECPILLFPTVQLSIVLAADAGVHTDTYHSSLSPV